MQLELAMLLCFVFAPVNLGGAPLAGVYIYIILLQHLKTFMVYL